MFQLRTAVVYLAATLTLAAQPAKRPLQHRDYDGWRTILSQALSRDGKFLAYAVFPEEGDGEVVVQNLATGREIRENAGAVPTTPAAANPETGEPAAPRTVRLMFTHDNRFLVAGTFPSKAEIDKARKDKETARNGMLIFDLTALTAVRVGDVASFQIPEVGASFVAYLKGPKSAEHAQPTENDQDWQELDARKRDQRRAGAGRGGRGRAEASDLILRDLRTGKERTFDEAIEYSISKDAAALVYAVSSKKDESNGLYDVTPGSDAAPVALLAGKGRYADLTWDFAQHELAFLSDRDDTSAKSGAFKAYLWKRSGAPVEIASNAVPGFRAGYGIFDRSAMNFSRDGSRLFLNCAPVEEIAALEKDASPVALSDDKVLADLWSWKDDYIQPMQKVRAAQERSRSYRAMINLSDHKFVQLSDPTMIQVVPSEDGRVALGADDRAYRRMVDYDATYNDVYLVDTESGVRRLALKQYRGTVGGGRGGAGNLQLSPDGKYILAFRDKQWWTIDASGAIVDLTAKLGPAFQVEDHDSPDDPPAYGSAGWTKDSRWALLYDRYDVWAVSPDGAVAHKLTSGRGSELQFRVARLENPEDPEERAIDEAKPFLLRAEIARHQGHRILFFDWNGTRPAAETLYGSAELSGARQSERRGCGDGRPRPHFARSRIFKSPIPPFIR